MAKLARTGIIFSAVVASLLWMLAPGADCQAQDAEGAKPTPTSRSSEGAPAPDLPPAPQAAAPAGSGQGRFSARFTARERKGPTRESWGAISLGTKYLNGIVGGFDRGGGFGFGLELTTADKIPFVELRATALGSTKLYRRFEGGAYFPKGIERKTHAEA